MSFQYPKAGDLQRGSTLILNPAPDSRALYAAISRTGDIVTVADTRQEALASLSGEVWVDDEDDLPPAPKRNPAGDNPRRALERAGLGEIDFDDVMKLSPDDAHRILLPYFSMLSRSRGGETKRIAAYNTARGMAERFLGQNYKLEKQAAQGEDPALVMGLTLLPADRLTTKYTQELDKNGDVFIAVNKLLRGHKIASIADTHSHLTPAKREQQWTLCAGSNDECKNSCLLYTGRNVADTYNHRRKAVGTLALLEQPVAFIRMLTEAITMHSRSDVCRGMKPYVRLNVLSDVPWELLVPGLFDYFRDYAMPGFSPVQFYDYTKVANRKPPSNYDLTFSFSGTNEGLARSEIALGRRVAVVFLAMRPKGKRELWKPFRYSGKAPRRGAARPQAALPEEFWGLPVIDGDRNDLRPRDPAPSIIGLRWKTPSGKAIDATDEKFSFVTRVYHVDGEIFSDRNDAQSARMGEMEFLASPVTPRYQPIESDEI